MRPCDATAWWPSEQIPLHSRFVISVVRAHASSLIHLHKVTCHSPRFRHKQYCSLHQMEGRENAPLRERIVPIRPVMLTEAVTFQRGRASCTFGGTTTV